MGNKTGKYCFQRTPQQTNGGSLKQNTFIIEHKHWTLHVAWNLTFWNENATKDSLLKQTRKRHKILILCTDLMEHNNNMCDFVGTFVGK